MPANHSTAPTIGEATMTDREVNHCLMLALGWEYLPNTSSTYQHTKAPRALDSCFAVPIEFAGNEKAFARYVIPALDERGLGEKYVEEIARRLWPHSDQVAWYADEVWTAFKAPLSLRARAALSVLENAHG